jgi:hypothetical protein
MSKHTPGPWKAHFEEAYYVTGPDRGRVAMMLNLKGAHGLGGRRTGEESAANARLIAAAPETAAERDRLKEINEELLDALVDVMFRHVPFSNKAHYANHARAVIAKATGAAP